jgi:hypothetical protein
LGLLDIWGITFDSSGNLWVSGNVGNTGDWPQYAATGMVFAALLSSGMCLAILGAFGMICKSGTSQPALLSLGC